MKFAHLGDCHLGGWRHPQLSELNTKSFQAAIEISIKERVEFVLVAGDLFDSPYPSIETLKMAFNEFRKLKEEKIPVFLIAGSHDFSASGKSFLDVLEKAGLCVNVSRFTEHNESIILEPTIFKNIAIYGYSGKKSSLEVEDFERIKLNDAPGMFKILMLHTQIYDAVKSLPIKSVDERKLPKVDYLALAHLHIDYAKENRVYSGPTFPNNLAELMDLKYGTFFIYENGKARREILKIKEPILIDLELNSTFNATEIILNRLDRESLANKIIILRLSGILQSGKMADIDFQKIEGYAKQKGAFVFLKSTTKLHMEEQEITLELPDSSNLEGEIIRDFEETHPTKFNVLISPLMSLLQIEKSDDEKSAVFEDRLLTESRKVLGI